VNNTEEAAPNGTSVPGLVGEKLRTWRQQAGMSIREVAERSGLSVSFISLVERGQTEIAVTRLIRLTDVFGRQLSDVVSADDDVGREDSSTRGCRVQARAYRLAKGVEMTYWGDPGWATQPFMILLQPGAVHGPVLHSYKELAICVDGEATMVISGQPQVLTPGDSVTLEPHTHHAYMNTSSSPCRLIALDFRKDDIRVLLATWDQIERSTNSSSSAARSAEAHAAELKGQNED
jgi:transcriptional regulator with XRE-family HTH domain